MIEIILITIIILGVSFFIMGLCNRWLPKRLGCEIMGWHLSPTAQGFDGCSFNGTCPRCGKEVLQDSQGNWF
jgi:hypothetical protein